MALNHLGLVNAPLYLSLEILGGQGECVNSAPWQSSRTLTVEGKSNLNDDLPSTVLEQLEESRTYLWSVVTYSILYFCTLPQKLERKVGQPFFERKVGQVVHFLLPFI